MRAKKARHIIVLRFSALGDVAIASPLLKYYALNNPSLKFTMVSRPILKPLFEGVPNLDFFEAQFKGRHKGVKGLFFLFKDLMRLNPTAIADFHSVLRTHILRLYFIFTSVAFSSMDKERAQRRALTRRKNKRVFVMEPVVRRYEKVLIKLGLEDSQFSTNAPKAESKVKKSSTGKLNIGIAPFAAHKGKSWPLEKMERLLSMLQEGNKFEISLFGGGATEIEILKGWEKRFEGVDSLAGKGSMRDELEAIKQLDLMISMDSANMHFASCFGVPVISIWGATHPSLGFYGLGQDPKLAIQSDIECRPCSTFGNRVCYRDDYACLEEISPERVFDEIINFFNLQL